MENVMSLIGDRNDCNIKKLGCYSVQLCLAGVGVGQVFVKKLFTCVMLWLYTEFQCSTMPGTGEKVCGVVVVVGGVVT